MLSTWHVYGNFKDLPRRTASNQALCPKAFNIGKNPKYDGYQKSFSSMVYKSFDKKSSGSGMKNEIMPEQKLAEQLQKPIFTKI